MNEAKSLLWKWVAGRLAPDSESGRPADRNCGEQRC